MRHLRVPVLLAGLLALTLAGPGAVRAEDPAHVVIDMTYLVYSWSTDDPVGTFTLSGTYEDAGTCTITGSTVNDDGSYTSTHALEGEDGTIVVKLEIGAAYHGYWYSARRLGVFTVLSGTGAYADLESEGETLVTIATGTSWGVGLPGASYTQTLYHLDSDPPPNTAPTVGLLASALSQPGTPPYTYNLYANAWDADGMPVKFEWDFDGDGTWDADSGSVSNQVHTYPSVGTYDPKVRVTDNDGATTTATVQVVVVPPPTVAFLTPTNGSTVSGTVTLSASVTNATTLNFYANGAFLGSASGSTLAPWTGAVVWNTTTVANGTYTLTATAVGTNMLTATASIQVTVANGPPPPPPPPPPVVVTAIAPNTLKAGKSVQVTVTGSGFATGATLSFTNGSGPAPAVKGAVVTGTTQITATVSVKNGGPKGNRLWDVVVTNPNGQTGSLPSGFTVYK
jgi:hypothetical protein